jgi:hypothetical protein
MGMRNEPDEEYLSQFRPLTSATRQSVKSLYVVLLLQHVKFVTLQSTSR